MIDFDFTFHLLHAIFCYLIVDKYILNLDTICLVVVLITFALPDIDHKNSILGSRLHLSWIFNILGGHRGFTHSLICYLLVSFISFKISEYVYTPQVLYGTLIGYGSHLLADTTTPKGIKLLWPLPIDVRIPIISKFKVVSSLLWIFGFFYLLNL